MGQNPTETGPIEEESSVEQQSVGVAIGILDSVIAEIKDPTSTFLYDITCDKSTHIKDLEEIMSHLEDAWNALDTEALPTGDENKMWCNFLIPEMTKLNCGHHPQRAYRLSNGDLVGECLKCNYSAVQDIYSDHEGERQAEADAERRADAALELSAELASCDW